MKKIAWLVMILMFGAGWARAETRKPNILFIFGDDWGYGDLGCYGHKELKTPNLDKLASQGTRYTHFYVTSGVCSPSRCGVITGHFPPRHRIFGHFAANEKNAQRGMPNWLALDAPSLPRLLQKAGYKTAHYGKWHLGGGGLPHGDPSAPKPAEYGYDETRVWNGNGPTWKGEDLHPTVRYMDDDKVWAPASSKLAVDATIDFVTRHKDQPFYVNLWLKDPHEPLWPTDEQRAPYKDKFENPKQCYYAVLSDADRHVGRLLEKLDELGLSENTLVIFSSDNGPENLNDTTRAGITAGLKGRKRYVHEGGVRVPFIVRWPGKTPVGKVDENSVMSAVDFMPTFASLAGINMPRGYRPDGENITAALTGRPFERSKPLYWQKVGKNIKAQGPNWTSHVIREGDWKLLHNVFTGRTELYNIPQDPCETNNLAKKHPEKVKALLRKLETWTATLPERP